MQPPNLVGGKHRRQLAGLFGAYRVDPLELDAKHFAIQKEESGEGLALRGCGDLSIDGQVREEGGDLRLAHVFGIAACCGTE